jgi:hypothetical protein
MAPMHDSPTTVQRQSNDSPTTVQRQSNDSPTTVHRQSNDSPTTVQRQSNNSPTTAERHLAKSTQKFGHAFKNKWQMYGAAAQLYKTGPILNCTDMRVL